MTRTPQDARRLLTGVAAAAAAVLIWAGWLVGARATVAPDADGLTPFEIAFLRTAAPALLLAPIWARPLLARGAGPLSQRLADCLLPPGTPWPALLLMSAWGAPFVYFAATGLENADVAVAAALIPGAMPLWAAALAAVLTGARPGGLAVIGLPLIALAAALTLAPALLGPDPAGAAQGAPWFAAAAISWAAFAVAFPLSGLTAAHAAGLVGAYSLVGLVAVDFWARASGSGPRLSFSAVGGGDLLIQALGHGLLAGVLAVIAFAAALERLGPRVAALSALVPGLAALMAWGALGETPSLWRAAALAIASIGVGLTQIAAVRGISGLR